MVAGAAAWIRNPYQPTLVFVKTLTFPFSIFLLPRNLFFKLSSTEVKRHLAMFYWLLHQDSRLYKSIVFFNISVYLFSVIFKLIIQEVFKCTPVGICLGVVDNISYPNTFTI